MQTVLFVLCWSALVAATPAKYVGGYYPCRLEGVLPPVDEVHSNYNLIFLFSARAADETQSQNGHVQLLTPKTTASGGQRISRDAFKSQVQSARSKGKTVILSAGGASGPIDFRQHLSKENFVADIKDIITWLGGVDGLDFNTFEQQDPDTSAMGWIASQLKSAYGSQFLFMAPPAPCVTCQETNYLPLMKQLRQNGALDFVGPQWYDGPNLARMDFDVDKWTAELGQRNVLIGFGVSGASGYWSGQAAQNKMAAILQNHTDIAGAFNWEIGVDRALGYPFATGVGALLRDTGTGGGRCPSSHPWVYRPDSDFCCKSPKDRYGNLYTSLRDDRPGTCFQEEYVPCDGPCFDNSDSDKDGSTTIIAGAAGALGLFALGGFLKYKRDARKKAAGELKNRENGEELEATSSARPEKPTVGADSHLDDALPAGV